VTITLAPVVRNRVLAGPSASENMPTDLFGIYAKRVAPGL